MLVTANQPFGKWGSIFPDQAMTLTAVDPLWRTPPPSSNSKWKATYRRCAVVSAN